MIKFKLEASDGEVLSGSIPESWAEVPLRAYVTLALTAQDAPAGVEPTAHFFSSDASCEALAPLLGLATAAPLLTNRSLLLDLFEAAPWLFLCQLPAGEPVGSFTHAGTFYTYTGGMDHLTAGQWEALAKLLGQADTPALSCGPHLLAVLYYPTGQPKQTEKIVSEAAEAFATLPVSIAWPALQAFLARSLPLALPIQRYSAARLQIGQALSALEKATASPASAPRGFYLNIVRWLAKTWLRLVKRQLRMSSPPSATTELPPPSSWGRRLLRRLRPQRRPVLHLKAR